MYGVREESKSRVVGTSGIGADERKEFGEWECHKHIYNRKQGKAIFFFLQCWYIIV